MREINGDHPLQEQKKKPRASNLQHTRLLWLHNRRQIIEISSHQPIPLLFHMIQPNLKMIVIHLHLNLPPIRHQMIVINRDLNLPLTHHQMIVILGRLDLQPMRLQMIVIIGRLNLLPINLQKQRNRDHRSLLLHEKSKINHKIQSRNQELSNLHPMLHLQFLHMHHPQMLRIYIVHHPPLGMRIQRDQNMNHQSQSSFLQNPNPLHKHHPQQIRKLRGLRVQPKSRYQRLRSRSQQKQVRPTARKILSQQQIQILQKRTTHLLLSSKTMPKKYLLKVKKKQYLILKH